MSESALEKSGCFEVADLRRIHKLDSVKWTIVKACRVISHLPQSGLKVREAIKLIEADSWYLARTCGSHRQFKHPTKKGLVTIAGKPSDDLAPGTLNSIMKRSGLK